MEHEVIVRIPSGFRFNGEVPYDMQIIANEAFVTVEAATMQEAQNLAEAYFNANVVED
jgi:hypothetical protein